MLSPNTLAIAVRDLKCLVEPVTVPGAVLSAVHPDASAASALRNTVGFV